MTFQFTDDLRQTITEAASVDFSVPDVVARAGSSPSSPLLICVVKDELDLLEDFYAHNRALGIDRFLIIDNGSTDGTDEYCAAQADTTLYRVSRPFSWQTKQGWISRVIAEHGMDRWYLSIDVDERPVFAGSEQHGISDLARKADELGLRRVRGCMIDMYSGDPLLESKRDRGQTLIEAFPLFDGDGYVEERTDVMLSCTGGPRKRVFSAYEPGLRPELSKYPLFKPGYGELMANPHHHVPFEENFASDRFIGLLHFKFLPGFVARIQRAVEAGNYWQNSFEYRCYLKAVRENPALTLSYSGSRKYSSSMDLVQAGVIADIGLHV